MTAGAPDNKQISDQDEPDELVSKSQLKREAHAVRDLASELIELNKSQLAKVPLDEDIRHALQQARSFKSHGARRRQLQYLAKLIRRIDVTAIIETIEGFHTEARGLTARQHRSEAWREVLLEQGDSAVSSLLQQRSDVDVQALRQLIRNARQELQAGKPPAASRALFRVLRELDTEQALPPCP